MNEDGFNAGDEFDTMMEGERRGPERRQDEGRQRPPRPPKIELDDEQAAGVLDTVDEFMESMKEAKDESCSPEVGPSEFESCLETNREEIESHDLLEKQLVDACLIKPEMPPMLKHHEEPTDEMLQEIKDLLTEKLNSDACRAMIIELQK